MKSIASVACQLDGSCQLILQNQRSRYPALNFTSDDIPQHFEFFGLGLAIQQPWLVPHRQPFSDERRGNGHLHKISGIQIENAALSGSLIQQKEKQKISSKDHFAFFQNCVEECLWFERGIHFPAQLIEFGFALKYPLSIRAELCVMQGEKKQVRENRNKIKIIFIERFARIFVVCAQHANHGLIHL